MYFKFSAQGRDLAPFVGNGTEVKKPSEIKSPLYFRIFIMTFHISIVHLELRSHFKWLYFCSVPILQMFTIWHAKIWLEGIHYVQETETWSGYIVNTPLQHRTSSYKGLFSVYRLRQKFSFINHYEIIMQ